MFLLSGLLFGQFVHTRSVKIGVTHTCGIGLSHTYGIGLSHTCLAAFSVGHFVRLDFQLLQVCNVVYRKNVKELGCDIREVLVMRSCQK